MKFKLLAATVAMAFAGMANASVSQTTDTGGSGLIFEAWDAANNVSFTQVLGSNSFNSIFTSGVAGTPSGTDQTFSLASGFSSVSGASNLLWHVVDVKGIIDTTSRSGVFTTWNSSSTPSINNNAVNNAVAGAGTQFGNINTLLGTATSVVSNGVSDPTQSAYAGKTAWGANYGVAAFGNATVNSAISGFFTGPIDASTVYAAGSGVGMFLSAISNTSSGTTQSTKAFQSGSLGNNEWILTSDGTLTYHVASAPASVPLPAALWLFGSGLLGLIGIGRRRLVNA